MSEEVILELHDVKKTFYKGNTEIEVLKGVNLTLKKGERLAITGASGVGKTTLLHIIGGIEKPTSGRVMIDGVDITQMSEDELSEIRGKKTAFVFQFYHLLPDFTVFENLIIPGLIRRFPMSFCVKRAKELLEEVGLSHRMNHFPSELSGGEQQRAAIARALFFEPSILLADEPTGNLDPQTAKKVFELLINVAKEKGISILLATHNLWLAEKIGRFVQMIDGRLNFPEER